jgi:predicted O-methyltransferase YrrM
MKKFVKSFLGSLGYEICRLYPSEIAELPVNTELTYREAQAYRALGNMGQLSMEEARLLSDLVRRCDPSRPIIEIGTLFGFSTIVMVLAKRQEQRLITVDNFSWNPLGISGNAHFAITSNRLSEAVAHHHVEIVRSDKAEFYKSYCGPPPALFFCDADHSYEATKTDIEWAQSVGSTIICGDDYDHPRDRGTARAVDKLGGPRELAGGLFVM